MKLPKPNLQALTAKLVPSPERLRRSWTKWLGYPAFFAAALWLSLYATFPREALRDRLAVEARNRLATEVQIGSVGLAGFTGITLHDVSWVADDSVPPTPPPAGDGGEEAADEAGEAPAIAPPPPVDNRVVLDRITVKAGVLSLLGGRKAFTFDVDAWGGNLAGRYESRDGGLSVQAKLRGVDLARTPLRPLAGVELVGKLARADLVLESTGKDFTKATGSLALNGEELELKGGKVQGFELPAIALGALDGNVVIENGKATFETFRLKGQDLDAQVEGSIRLASKISSSSLSGKLKLKPSDDWWSKNEMLKGVANLALPAGKDGWRTVGLYGQLDKPSFRPQR